MLKELYFGNDAMMTAGEIINLVIIIVTISAIFLRLSARFAHFEERLSNIVETSNTFKRDVKDLHLRISGNSEKDAGRLNQLEKDVSNIQGQMKVNSNPLNQKYKIREMALRFVSLFYFKPELVSYSITHKGYSFYRDCL